MKKIRSLVIVLNLMAVMVFFAFSVWEKKRIIEHGQLVLLELAPVDPRSLMQGDYMELQYYIDSNINTYEMPKRGYSILKRISENVHQVVRLEANIVPLESDEILLKYHLNKWRINFGAESYFFQEGHSEKYENAKYGGLKVDPNGNSVLVGLYDSNYTFIE